jgi:hypothetical protein
MKFAETCEFFYWQSLSPKARAEVFSNVRAMCVTLGIDNEVDGQQGQLPKATDQRVSSNGKSKGKKTTKKRRTNLSLSVTNILKSFDSPDDIDEDTDEVDEYFRSKMTIADDEPILRWWKNRSLVFPR